MKYRNFLTRFVNADLPARSLIWKNSYPQRELFFAFNTFMDRITKLVSRLSIPFVLRFWLSAEASFRQTQSVLPMRMAMKSCGNSQTMSPDIGPWQFNAMGLGSNSKWA